MVPTLMLQHKDLSGESFFTLYGHLDPECLELWQPGDSIQAGTVLPGSEHHPETATGLRICTYR